MTQGHPALPVGQRRIERRTEPRHGGHGRAARVKASVTSPWMPNLRMVRRLITVCSSMEHPVVELDVPHPPVHRQRERVDPPEGIARAVAQRLAHHIVGGAAVAAVAQVGEVPRDAACCRRCR